MYISCKCKYESGNMRFSYSQKAVVRIEIAL